MLNKIPSLLYVLSIYAMTSSLHSHLYCNSLCHDNISEFNIEMMNISKDDQHYLDQEVPDITPQYGEKYDFIIIGAGTAGAAIAARLTEISQYKVLLIEAGFHENLFMDIPQFAPLLQLDDNINWQYQTKPSDKYCLGMKNNSCFYPRGKVIGGSSVLNYMIASRGGAEDYDRWAKMGNEGWAYKNVLKYFKKLETMDIPELKLDTVYHGTDGPVHITSRLCNTPLGKAFLEAGEELGYSLVDYNGKNEIGFSYLQNTIKNGTRMSSNRAYLHPIHDRNNLRVTLKSTVTKVLIDRNTKRAIGVEFIKSDRTVRVFASKEVILCAGAIGSPQLLMLSGIGPEKHLTELGIDVVQDAPVGENLMDHLAYYGLAWIINASIGLHKYEQLNPLNPNITDFLINRTEPLTLPRTPEALGFVNINTKLPKKHNDYLPDIELLFGSGIYKDNFVRATILNIKDEICHEWQKYDGTNGWSIASVLSKPKSRGRITLLANDVNVKPEIVPNYFDNPDDMKMMIAGVRAAFKVVQTKAMQAFNPWLPNITYIECNNYKYDSDAYWECALRMLSASLYHPCGTCKMAPSGDPTAVVDPTLKVIGIQRLRVVDASIMPEITSGHLSLPVYMIAEKAADMIKKEWKKSLEKS